MLLMCVNTPVYDIENEEVLQENLLPGYMKNHFSNQTVFKKWLKLRYSSNTNTLARQLKGIVFGQGNRIVIDRETRAFGLSDGYWLKDKNVQITFEELSPYYNPFWTGDGMYSSGAIPTLYVGGYLTKKWINAQWLYKVENIIEVECSRLCRLSGIPCAEIHLATENINLRLNMGIMPLELDHNNLLSVELMSRGIFVKNFTSPEIMLEQADMSGFFDEDNYDNKAILDVFGLDGFKMIVVDAIFGNGDRHLGNFGFLRQASTGEYLGMSPLYDFDHALDSKNCPDMLMNEVLTLCSNIEYKETARKIADTVAKHTINNIFEERARWLIKQLRE